MMLEKAGIKYTWVDAEENKELTYKFKVRSAPTLLVPSEEGFSSFENASNIKGFIESQK